ncbi:MAG TPA: RNA polymerase sigma-70 factor [Saprospiraceae bacterium]|nr:RNA polymerase sigma-70 factor [Saprospiraceae bacterium]
MNRLRSGDQSALKTLYTQHFPALVKVAANITGETAQAKDVVQNTFVQLWAKRETLQIEVAIYPYLRRMVIHEVLAMQRKTERRTALWQKQKTTKTFHTDVEDALHEKEMQAAIRTAINALPERCSEIFKLSRYNEMTYAEIAEALDLSVKTVENQMGKALKILRETLSGYL